MTEFASYSCFLILSLVLVNAVRSTSTGHYHECPHDKLPKKFLVRTHLEDSYKSKAAKTFTVVGRNGPFNQPIRINLHYNFTFLGVLSETKQQQVKTIMGQVKENLESILTVRRTPSPLRLRRHCVSNQGEVILTGPTEPCPHHCVTDSVICGAFPVPSEHLQRCVECNGDSSNCVEAYSDGPGIEADLALYVYGFDVNCDEGTIAYATTCQLEDRYDRPISGIINFCPSDINDAEHVFQVAKHEIFHVLGFSDNLYPWYRDERGNPRTRRDANGNPPTDANGNYIAAESTVKTVDITDWHTRFGTMTKTVTQLVTPKLVEVGRRHFNCDTLEGVQLEDQGGSGTSGSHWEKRLLNYEAMTGVISENLAFSNFSYALLEDSGWYKVDYSKASILVWGRGDGCGYVAGSCGGYIDSKRRQNRPIAPFCDFFTNDEFHPQNLKCNIDRTAVAFCNLVDNYLYVASYVSIPREYQYLNWGANFDNSPTRLPFYGGRIQSADFCPYYLDLFRQAPQGICRKGIPLTTNNEAAETYGPRSRCVDHSGKWQITNGSRTYTAQYSAGCYEYQCSNSAVTIMILGQSYTCSRAGQVIQVDQTTNGVKYRGGIVCPSCVEICYDDFTNCPEAAKLYGELASPTPSKSVGNPTSSTASVGSVTSTVGVGSSTSSTATVGSSTTSTVSVGSPTPATDSAGNLLPIVKLLFAAIFASFMINY